LEIQLTESQIEEEQASLEEASKTFNTNAAVITEIGSTMKQLIQK